jgi:hypothetical protein
MRDRLEYLPHPFRAGQALADQPVPLEGFLLVGIALPTPWEGGALTYRVGLDPQVLRDFYRADGTEIAHVAAANRHLLVVPEDFAGVPYLQLRSGTAALPVVQSADRTVLLIVRPL